MARAISPFRYPRIFLGARVVHYAPFHVYGRRIRTIYDVFDATRPFILMVDGACVFASYRWMAFHPTVGVDSRVLFNVDRGCQCSSLPFSAMSHRTDNPYIVVISSSPEEVVQSSEPSDPSSHLRPLMSPPWNIPTIRFPAIMASLSLRKTRH